jgi:conjugal transfer pilin signal peptidase TrbI
MVKVNIVKKKEPWGKFLIKLGITSVVMALIAAYGLARYDFGFDSQVNRCLHPYRAFAIDTWNQEISVGNYLAFHAHNMGPFFDDGQVVVKQVVAISGDTVEIRNGKVFINGAFSFGGFQEAGLKGQPLESFNGTTVLGEGEYFMYGWHPLSYDSRYWGPVSEAQVIGETYALF